MADTAAPVAAAERRALRLRAGMAAKRLTAEELAHALEAPTGHRFADPARLRRALTHASVRHSTGFDYERFEFLGDRVLGLIIAEMLFTSFPDAPEGELSVRLNALVNAEALASIADEIGLTGLIQTGSELRPAERKRVNLRADATEALIAALYLDGGMEAARKFVLRYWEPRSRTASTARRDPKTELQEWAHQAVSTSPSYKLISREGPDHEPLFTVSVHVGGLVPENGSGRSKREAEQAAAAALLRREGIWKDAAEVAQ